MRQGIGCLGMLLVGGAIVGAISAFMNGNVGLGWFFVIAGIVIQWPIGWGMMRASTAEHGTLSAAGHTATTQLDHAMKARQDNNPTLAAQHWDSAMRRIPGMRRGGDWTGLMLIYIVRYATLRADGAEQQAIALMAEWRSQVSTAPELFRYKFVNVLQRMESLSRSDLMGIADGQKEIDDLLGDVLDA